MRPAYAYALLGIGFSVIIAALIYTPVSITDSSPMNMMNMKSFTITSPAFVHGGIIPSLYTCDGDRKLSPPLVISGIPAGTRMLALVMDDPDVPKARKPDGIFDHWVLYNIPTSGSTFDLPEGGGMGVLGVNGAGEPAYTGPCPPPEFEPSEHRYFFKVFALSELIDFRSPPTKTQLLQGIQSIMIGEAELMGRYKRIQP